LFKQKVVEAGEGATHLTLKELAPVRLIKNKFYNDIQQAYADCATVEELKSLLGRARAKKGMFEGDMEEGELEIGQVSAIIHEIKPAAQIVMDMMEEFTHAKAEVRDL
jgi:enoyl-[acyl-carrier protein] reductase II